MIIFNKYCEYLFNYLTVNGKCAHYIDRPKINIIDQGMYKKITCVYNSDQIEYKINKSKLIKITQDFFNINFKINCFIIKNVGPNSDKTNLTVMIPNFIFKKLKLNKNNNQNIKSQKYIENFNNIDEEIKDYIEI